MRLIVVKSKIEKKSLLRISNALENVNVTL